MDIRRANCVQALRSLGFSDAENYLGDYAQTGPFGQLEEGLISPDEFRAFIRSKIDRHVTDAQIDSAFDKFLIGIPVERLRQLKALRRTYGVYMLSNTNPIMWHSKIAADFKEDGQDVDAYFDGIVTSFEAKALKPHPEIFEYAIRNFNLVPAETLFLDDSEANLRGAEALGFQTALVAPGHEFLDVLKGLGLV